MSQMSEHKNTALVLPAAVQRAAFGYYDPEAPLPGSWKAAVCEMIQAGELPPALFPVVRAVIQRMHQQIYTHVRSM